MKKAVSLFIILAMLISGITVYADMQSAQIDYFEMICSYTAKGGEITIHDCLDTITGSVVIPSHVRGNKVTKIDNHAFKDCYYITDITLPDTLTTIGDYAFENCLFLERVYIPPTVTSIGYYAFYTNHVNLKLISNSNHSYVSAYAKVYGLNYVHKTDGVTLVVKGVTNTGDTKAYKENDKVMVPFRTVCEMMGYDVTWNEDNTINVTGADYSALVKVGEHEASVNREKAQFEVAPFYKDGTTYIGFDDLKVMFKTSIIYDTRFEIVYVG